MTDDWGSIEIAALRFYHARVKKRDAKAALKAYRLDNGACISGGIMRAGIRTRDGDEGPCWSDAHAIYPFGIMPRDEWCEVCLGSQPLWEHYRKMNTEAQAALRRLMHLCKKAATP